MSISYAITNTPQFLNVVAEGKGNRIDEVQKYVQAVILAIQENKAKRIFCNEINLTHELTGIDTYVLGEMVSQYAVHVEKVAVVCSVSDLPKEKFYELVTSNRGLYIQIFTDLSEAKNWLLFP
ncbi:MAG: DUF4180 domain-containing protein [Ignavibacteria bacterium]|nr:DUF4180 domain-containing protein [Ignavibacteria bacterium]